MIRTATIDDLVAIHLIESTSYPETEAAGYDSIKARLSAYANCCYVNVIEGQIVSFIMGITSDLKDLKDEMYHDTSYHVPDGDWLMIFSVATDPSCRLQGYSKQIMVRLIDDMRKQDRKGLVLTCKEHMIPFYAQFGFSDEGLSDSNHGNVSWHQMRLVL